MNSSPYPQAVSAIVNDYLQRLDSQLTGLAFSERREFVREIESHVFEAYAEDSTADEVERILRVLRKIGEPASVVEERLSDSLVRSGSRHRTPLRIAAGVLIALFGLPLGIGGVAALFGVLLSLGGLLLAYFAFAGSLAIAGVLLFLIGATRIYFPGLWDRLIEVGVLQIDPDLQRVLSLGDAGTQGFLILLAGAALLAGSAALFYFGRSIFRGISNLAILLFERARQVALSLRKYFTQQRNHYFSGHVAQRI